MPLHATDKDVLLFPLLAAPAPPALPDWLIWAGLIAGALGSLGILGAFFRKLLHLAAMLDQIIEVLPTIVEIGTEFRPNGGLTLKDQVTSIQTGVAEAKAKAEAATNAVVDEARLAARHRATMNNLLKRLLAYNKTETDVLGTLANGEAVNPVVPLSEAVDAVLDHEDVVVELLEQRGAIDESLSPLLQSLYEDIEQED